MIQTDLIHRKIMMENSWELLINSVKKLHEGNYVLQNFCPFPNDLVVQKVEPFHIEAGNLIKREKNLNTEKYQDLCDKIIESCLLYTSPSPRDRTRSRMPSSA